MADEMVRTGGVDLDAAFRAALDLVEIGGDVLRADAAVAAIVGIAQHGLGRGGQSEPDRQRGGGEYGSESKAHVASSLGWTRPWGA